LPAMAARVARCSRATASVLFLGWRSTAFAIQTDTYPSPIQQPAQSLASRLVLSRLPVAPDPRTQKKIPAAAERDFALFIVWGEACAATFPAVGHHFSLLPGPFSDLPFPRLSAPLPPTISLISPSTILLSFV
jgi:hypothetical protein